MKRQISVFTKIMIGVITICFLSSVFLWRIWPKKTVSDIIFIYELDGSSALHTITEDGVMRNDILASVAAPGWLDSLYHQLPMPQKLFFRSAYYGEALHDPTWLPSLNGVGYFSKAVGQNCEWVNWFDLTNEEVNQITCLQSTLREEGYDWSPDGRLFTYAARENNFTLLISLDLTGKPIKKHILNKNVWGLAWSPDASLLAVAADHDISLHIFNQEGLLSSLAPENIAISKPTWSPDGQKIAFFCTVKDRPVYIPPLNICTIGIDGNGFYRKEIDQTFPYIKKDLRWSPTGEKLSFVGVQASGFNDIFVLDLIQDQIMQLTSHPAGDSAPNWSADGQTIVFSSNRDGNWELYSIQVDGASLTRLTNTPGNELQAEWRK